MIDQKRKLKEELKEDAIALPIIALVVFPAVVLLNAWLFG